MTQEELEHIHGVAFDYAEQLVDCTDFYKHSQLLANLDISLFNLGVKEHADRLKLLKMVRGMALVLSDIRVKELKEEVKKWQV